jgi:hypothetical protein
VEIQIHGKLAEILEEKRSTEANILLEGKGLIFTTQTYDLSLPCLAHTADSSAVLRSNSMSKQHFSGLTNRRG